MGDFQQWNPEPSKAKEFRSKQDYKEAKRGRHISGTVAAVFVLAIAVLLWLYFLKVV